MELSIPQIKPAAAPKLLDLNDTIDDSPTTPGEKEDSDKGETRKSKERFQRENV